MIKCGDIVSLFPRGLGPCTYVKLYVGIYMRDYFEPDVISSVGHFSSPISIACMHTYF